MDGQTIFLLRHGHIDTGSGKRLVGQTDIALSPAGIEQARQWAIFFSAFKTDRILCSDLARSRQTAEIIAGACNKNVEQIAELREIDLGLWDRLTRQEIDKRFPGAWERRGRDIAGYRPPDGESFTDLACRVIPAFTAISETSNGRTLIVTHAGVIRVIIAQILGMPLDTIFKFAVDYAGSAVLKEKKGGLMLQALNFKAYDRLH